MKLQKKFFLVLIGLATISVGFLLMTAISVFVKDKAIYIRENQLENAQLLAKQILLRIENSELLNAGQTLKFEDLKSENYRIKLLMDNQGKILASSLGDGPGSIQTIGELMPKEVVDRLMDPVLNEASFEIDTSERAGIISFVRIPQKNLTVVLESPQKSVFRASLVFIIRVVMALIGLVFFAALVSFLLARSMTRGLMKLELAMRSFGDGDLMSTCDAEEGDEIGKLGGYFNRMAADIRRLFDTQVEKLKLEFEMAKASELQSHFFPTADYSCQEVEFSGFFQPSSHCGGDWWYYFSKGDSFVVFIGDVSGHGMKSALMTSASRAIFGLIEDNFTDTSQAMAILNRCFHAAAVGEMNMSALLMSINKKTGALEYTNASHDPSLIWSPKTLPEGIADIDMNQTEGKAAFLSDIHGPRLGTQADSVYGKSTLGISEGTIIFSTTDGIFEIENEKKRKFGDNQLIHLIRALKGKEKRGLHLLRDEFFSELSKFGANLYQLEDDLSFVFLKYSGDPLNTKEKRL